MTTHDRTVAMALAAKAVGEPGYVGETCHSISVNRRKTSDDAGEFYDGAGKWFDWIPELMENATDQKANSP